MFPLFLLDFLHRFHLCIYAMYDCVYKCISYINITIYCYIIEMALQYVSMFLRSEPQWEVVEPLKEMGWRVRKSFFLLKNKQQPKERALLSWVSTILVCFVSSLVAAGDINMHYFELWVPLFSLQSQRTQHAAHQTCKCMQGFTWIY